MTKLDFFKDSNEGKIIDNKNDNLYKHGKALLYWLIFPCSLLN